MSRRDELIEEMIECEWQSLPYFERWAYPKSTWRDRKFHLKKRLHAQKWEVQYTQTLAIILSICAITSFFFPDTNWSLTLFLGLAAVAVYGVEVLMKYRLKKIKQVKKLRKKIK